MSEEPSGIVNIMGKVAAVKDPELKYKMYAAFESIDTPAEDDLMIDLMKHLSSKIENLAGGGVSLNIQAKLNCDEVLRSQLVFQRGATSKSRIQAVIAQVQFHEPECARDVWKPVAIDMSATTGLCYRSSRGYTTAGTQLQVGGRALPESLQRTVGGNQTPRHTSGRDSGNNIIVYWADNTADRPFRRCKLLALLFPVEELAWEFLPELVGAVETSFIWGAVSIPRPETQRCDLRSTLQALIQAGGTDQIGRVQRWLVRCTIVLAGGRGVDSRPAFI